MQIENKKQEKIVGIIMGSLFMFAGLFVLAIMLLSMAKEKAFNNENGQTMAYVEKIERAADYSDVIYVTYEVDGKEYSNVKLGYETSAAEGYQISVYYDKDNPGIIVKKNFVLQNATLGICISVVLIIAGIVALIIALRKSNKTQKPEKKITYKSEKMKIKIAVFSVALVFLIAGIAMVVSATRQSPEAKDFSENAMSVAAYVDRVVEYKNSSSSKRPKYTYYYYLSYEVDGVKYSNISFVSTRHYFNENENVNIYYHREKPTEISPVKNVESDKKILKTVGWILTGIGGFVALIGTVAKPAGTKDN